MDHPHRTRWAIAVPLVTLCFVVGLGGLLAVRLTDLDGRPWAYVFAGIGLISAPVAVLLAVLRTHDVAD